MDQAAYSFLVGTFGGAVGGVFAIAVAMWYTDFISRRKDNRSDKSDERDENDLCPNCRKRSLSFDQYGAFCKSCKKSFTVEPKPLEIPQPQIEQSATMPKQEIDTPVVAEPLLEQEQLPQKIVRVFLCPSCQKELTSKAGLLLHMKKKHSSSISTINT